MEGLQRRLSILEKEQEYLRKVNRRLRFSIDILLQARMGDTQHPVSVESVEAQGISLESVAKNPLEKSA